MFRIPPRKMYRGFICIWRPKKLSDSELAEERKKEKKRMEMSIDQALNRKLSQQPVVATIKAFSRTLVEFFWPVLRRFRVVFLSDIIIRGMRNAPTMIPIHHPSAVVFLLLVDGIQRGSLCGNTPTVFPVCLDETRN